MIRGFEHGTVNAVYRKVSTAFEQHFDKIYKVRAGIGEASCAKDEEEYRGSRCVMGVCGEGEKKVNVWGFGRASARRLFLSSARSRARGTGLAVSGLVRSYNYRKRLPVTLPWMTIIHPLTQTLRRHKRSDVTLIMEGVCRLNI